MMNEEERETARLGAEALDEALIALGEHPVGDNPDFHAAAPVIGDIPNAVLEKHGAAPLRFIFGSVLDVWVGPFSEVLTLKVSEGTREVMRRGIEDVLCSAFTCRPGKRSVEIALQLPDTRPWLRLKVRASGLSYALEPFYAPYCQRGQV